MFTLKKHNIALPFVSVFGFLIEQGVFITYSLLIFIVLDKVVYATAFIGFMHHV